MSFVWIGVDKELPPDGVMVLLKNSKTQTSGWKLIDARMHEDCPSAFCTDEGIMCDITHWASIK